MRFLSAAVGIVLIAGLTACNSPDRERAKEQAREDVHKASDGAKRAGHEIKEEAKDLSRRVDAAVKPDSESASDKVSAGREKVTAAASTAGRKLGHAALLAQVKAKLASEAGLSTIPNVEVTLTGSLVTLSGTVANETQRKAAETATAQVDGVTRVQNNLRIQP